MAAKGEKLKWNTPKGVNLEQVRKSVSGETDSRGRKARPRPAPLQEAAAKTRKARQIKRGKA